MKNFSELLKQLHACRKAREWAGNMTIEEIVEKCHRGDWMLWLANKVNVNVGINDSDFVKEFNEFLEYNLK